jgi:hypothetical protein
MVDWVSDLYRHNIQFYITPGTIILPFVAKIFDDDGSGGAPGTELFNQNVNTPTQNQWYTVDVSSQDIEFTEGSYYVSWHMTGENQPGMGVDSSAAQIGSRQSWEFTGVWAPFRNAEIQDVMIRTRISEVIVGVKEDPFDLPVQFAMHSAHPNPFNPVTVLGFDLPRDANVHLAVYDVFGRQVATLQNGWMSAGTHEAIFDGQNMSSGIYIYSLIAGDFNATGKIVLMK